MSRFDGRVAVITGAARGMGKVSALSFAREGAAVALTDVLADEVEAVAEEVRAAGGNAVAVPGDVTDPATIDRLVSEAATAERGSRSLRREPRSARAPA